MSSHRPLEMEGSITAVSPSASSKPITWRICYRDKKLTDVGSIRYAELGLRMAKALGT